MIGIRESLHTAVICHGKGRHTPLFRPLYDILDLGNAIHVAHFRMTVELHPLDGCMILPLCREVLTFLDTDNRPHRQLTIKFVDDGYSLDADKIPFFDRSVSIFLLSLTEKHFYGDAVCIVGDVKDHQLIPAFKLPFLHLDDLSPQDDFPDLSGNLTDLCDLSVKIPAEQDVRVF